MDYLEFIFRYDTEKDYIGDLLSAALGEIGFESFVKGNEGLTAYVPQNLYNEEAIKSLLASFEYADNIPYESKLIKGQNWNEEWEKHYFQPIIMGNDCVIHSTFHKDIPAATYEILIDPKMSFGTGHHETTSLMLGEVLKADIKGKSLLDMGCGTAVLAILASKRGANPILAIDIDEWVYENSLENIKLNDVNNIRVMQGGAELLGKEKFDIILANINRNILLHDMHAYAACMNTGSELFMSGFYKNDIPVIDEEAKKLGLKLISFEEKNLWVAVHYKKD
ncbi:MAG TPA: 50S ribosomal protein L11 methyltransferase [Paludibacteraceae bacterium]|nr:50S ribosomal protein L11 methyltransferase [Paludibacteraceae bacterium]HQF49461.1 50S ribosomal protein L11 methyltransferase [Paludibacteraceae bacterium]HQJ89262.1 50S ribosomal protein L11 methyltransferase [Paludibacteraceae bacterium]